MKNTIKLIICFVIVACVISSIYHISNVIKDMKDDAYQQIVDNPVCKITRKGLANHGFRNYTAIELDCEDGYIREIPESIWVDLSVGDSFDRLNIRKVGQ